ncbi:MAG TPA: 16S rRNA (adenine(1518)-N(6)/adenine(1519)-N(6))-dimethyltransferase RsmA [Candidatus Acidoferrales bacterium]|nr:16S rRNA (adenine(1518)-N(6)/adenine(1519)-N(6))-dimethyltransferase RsmA [Candidatus Acidoferrales bacterium]
MGQHFLGDEAWRQRILKILHPGAHESWIEVGPGHGEMTQLLAGDGRRVLAIEADTRLAEDLQHKIESHEREWPNVEIISADVLTVDFQRLLTGDFRVYGNLPYYITSPILHHLFDYAGQILSIHIVIQLEVAERIAARPGRREYGYLSALCQFYAKPEIVLRIPPGAFRPPPRVKSALVRMILPGERASLSIGDEKRFLEFVQGCFGQKRKTLRNNLRSLASDLKIHQVIKDCGLRPDARAEQLTLAQFAALFASLS